jgi:hypothetical protein
MARKNNIFKSTEALKKYKNLEFFQKLKKTIQKSTNINETYYKPLQ